MQVFKGVIFEKIKSRKFEICRYYNGGNQINKLILMRNFRYYFELSFFLSLKSQAKSIIEIAIVSSFTADYIQFIKELII